MTFSGLLNKSLKHHAAAATNSVAAAGATKPSAVTNATTATTATSTGTTQEQHTHIQNTVMISPKTDSLPIPGSVLSTMASSSPPQPISIDPTVLSIDPRSSPPSQLQLLSSQQPTTCKLDMKQPAAPAPLSPPSTTPSSPAATGTISITTTKKKQQQQLQQNVSAAQNASYRKRLNVNQVCDWCRYRKIRCDREAPCNSCQHSKRECIRTPPEVLLSKLNNKEAENSSTTVSTTMKATKRNCPANEQEDQTSSLKAKKVARNNGIAPSSSPSSSSSHINIEHNNNNSNTASTRLSPAMSNPLNLSPPSTKGLTLCGEQQQQQPMTMLTSGIQGTSSSLQDQEHLERMRRIEMLLSNVIPGAAEFIAHGHHQRSNSFSVPSNSQHGQHQQQRIMSPISPALTAAGSPLGLAPIQDDISDLSSPIQEDRGASLGGEGQQQQQQGRRPSVFAGQDYIERMKRIELLLGSAQDSNASVTKLSMGVPSSPAGADTPDKSSNNDNAKKEPTPTTRRNKAAGTKNVARNSDGTIIKRPHVAAGFAGQKPPPKLPQAIAEAALKKLTGKKKKRAFAATNSASATTAAVAAVASVVAVAPASPIFTITTATAPAQSSSAPQTKTEAPAA
ncbi:hypothetical protein BGZ47_000486, partial [Haplosporangium gracile]